VTYRFSKLVTGQWLFYHSAMLSLQSTTDDRWLKQVDAHLDEILIDHAHCEQKAASTAMGLLVSYIENEELCRSMTEIVNEELEHFHLVLALLKSRGIRFRRQRPGHYGRRLNAAVRKHEPQRAVDRLLVAGLIEARSCERFSRLCQHVTDTKLAEFYGGLFESEARHHTTYVNLARHFAPEADVRQRLGELAAEEARIIHEGHLLPRMHS
jgi:tRNA-(ms[2]io[6]A)-hydroxylase